MELEEVKELLPKGGGEQSRVQGIESWTRAFARQQYSRRRWCSQVFRLSDTVSPLVSSPASSSSSSGRSHGGFLYCSHSGFFYCSHSGFLYCSSPFGVTFGPWGKAVTMTRGAEDGRRVDAFAAGSLAGSARGADAAVDAFDLAAPAVNARNTGAHTTLRESGREPTGGVQLQDGRATERRDEGRRRRRRKGR